MSQLRPGVAKQINKLFFKKMFSLLCGQGPASSVSGPAIDILEFLFKGNELKPLTLGYPTGLMPHN